MSVIINVLDDEDPYGHHARAIQRDVRSWDVEYFRGGILVSDGGIGTPPPHMPPMATLLGTLQELRDAADRERQLGVSHG